MQREYLYRKGKYVYFRHPITKTLTRLPDDESSRAFEEQYGPLLRAVKGANDPKPPQLPPSCPLAAPFEPGTIGYFVGEYLGSDAFKGLSANTKRVYRHHLDAIRAHEIGRGPLHDLTPHYVDIYSGKIAREHSPCTADKHTMLISNLWQFARTYECFKRGDKHNPTLSRIRHHESDENGHLAWPIEVIDKFDGWAEPHLRQYRMGLHYTGQRGGDVLKMKWADYKNGTISVVQEKTDEKVWIACPAVLRDMLDAMPRVSDYIFTNSRGQRYADSTSLSNALRNHLRKCGFKDYSMHGLRKNAGMELALAGCNPNEIMAVLGHKTPKMALFYAKQADKVRLAQTASEKWNNHLKDEALRRAQEHEQDVAGRRQQLKAV
jgi:integrase